MKYPGTWRDSVFFPSLPLWECGLKYFTSGLLELAKIVTPFMGVWIEITNIYTRVSVDDVTPFMGVWIEMMHKNRETSLGQVTPFMGVWIEISHFCLSGKGLLVTPFMGVWIETRMGKYY